jgi:hypothetical protein
VHHQARQDGHDEWLEGQKQKVFGRLPPSVELYRGHRGFDVGQGTGEMTGRREFKLINHPGDEDHTWVD